MSVVDDSIAAWALSVLLIGSDWPDKLDRSLLGEPWDQIIPIVEEANGDGRRTAFEAYVSNLENAKQIIGMVYGADPYSIPVGYRPKVTWADLAAVIPQIEWMWRPWLPRGLLTLLVGESGSGKSGLALELAKRIIQGGNWPDGTPIGERGEIVWAETEAAQAVNLDRAKDWGVNLNRVIIPQLEDIMSDLRLDEEEHWDALIEAVRMPNVKLLIVDSLRGAFRGDENSSECVAMLANVAALARNERIAVLVIHHLRKKGIVDSSSIDLDRVRGSSVITQMARVVWAIDLPDPLTPRKVRLQMIKNNLAQFPDPLGFDISDDGLVFGDAPQEPRLETQRDKAADLIISLLNKGPRLATEMYEEAEGMGLSTASMKRAKKALGVVAVRNEGHWWWSLPADEDQFYG